MTAKSRKMQAKTIAKAQARAAEKIARWIDFMDQGLEAILDIRREFNILMQNGDRGQQTARDFEWALAFAPQE